MKRMEIIGRLEREYWTGSALSQNKWAGENELEQKELGYPDKATAFLLFHASVLTDDLSFLRINNGLGFDEGMLAPPEQGVEKNYGSIKEALDQALKF